MRKTAGNPLKFTQI